MAVGLVLCVVFVVFGLFSIRAWKRRAQRARQLAAVAAANGFTYSEEDTGDCTRVPFELFRRGDGRGAENVLSGRASDGAPVRVFDFYWYDEQDDGRSTVGSGGFFASADDDAIRVGTPPRSYEYATCCLTQVGAVYPPTVIEPRGLLGRALDVVGVRPIQFESEAFNRMFQVRGEDTRFIQHLIDPQVMDLLLGTEGKVRWELRGRWILASLDREDVTPDLVMGLVGLTTELRRRIPNVVRSMTTQLPAPDGGTRGSFDPGIVVPNMVDAERPGRQWSAEPEVWS
jgi:hypothetical protein